MHSIYRGVRHELMQFFFKFFIFLSYKIKTTYYHGLNRVRYTFCMEREWLIYLRDQNQFQFTRDARGKKRLGE